MSLELNIPSALIRNDNSPVFFQSNERTSFKIPDLTGVYDATDNPTGYGNSQFPIGRREVADIHHSIFTLTKPNDETNGVLNEYTVELNSSSTPTAADIADETLELEVTNATFGGINSDILPDGIYSGRYDVFFLCHVQASYSNGEFTINSGVWADYDVVVGSLIQIDGTDTFYIVGTVNGADLTFSNDDGAIPSSGTINFYIVYRTLFYVLLTKSSEKCWAESAPKAIGDLCCSECSDKSIIEVMKFATLLDTAKAAYVTENYSKSQEIVDYLVSKCTGNNLCTTCN